MGAKITDPETEENYYRWRLKRNGEPLRNVESIILFSDRFVNGNEFQLEVPQLLFERDDTIVVSQESLSGEAFDYYELLVAQATTLGQSSGTAPAVLRGNLQNVNDPSEVVLGYFSMSSIVTDTIVISPEN